MAEKNLRNMEITQSSGTDVKSTKQLSGEAIEPGFNEKNEQKEYVVSNPAFGPLGGKHTGT